MQTTQGSMLQSLRAVHAFLDQNAEPLAGVVKTGARHQLADAIAVLSGHARIARADLPVIPEVEPLRRGLRTGATQGLRQRLSTGRRIVHVLDAFVKSALKDNRSTLANWKVVLRVQKVAGRTALPVVPPTPTPAPTVHLTPVPPATPA